MTSEGMAGVVDRAGHPPTGSGIDLDGLSMSFGANQVLKGVAMHLEPGRITALIGANGAGKSTIIKILSGVYPDYRGTVTIDGTPQVIDSIPRAMALGIHTVHQRIDQGIVPGLSVAENLLFDRITAGGIPRVASLRRLLPPARAVAATLDLDWSPSFLRTDVFEIGIADQQLLLLARALSQRPRLLILDEPTSALSAAEVSRLFAVIRALRDSGVAILYVSHHLSEIDDLADRVFVLRDGLVQDDQDPPFDWATAVRAMLGDQVAHEVQRLDEQRGTTSVLRVEGVRLFRDSAPITLDVRGGEVTGVVGLLGAGKTELATGILGAPRFNTGSMTLRGHPYRPRHPADAVGHDVYFVPEDRASQAMLTGWSITRTTTLPFLRRFAAGGLLQFRREASHARSLVADFGVVTTSENQSVDSLSGGNQQKVVVGRWMRHQPAVLLLDEPFRGVDIGARREISHRAREVAAGGAAVMVFASDVDEILEVADRIVVLGEGTIRSDRYTSETDRDEILSHMSEVLR